MREIKFRGKSILTGEWVYGSLLQSEIPANGFCKTAICERFADSYNIQQHEVDPKTVGQYTGLRDKKWKEVYEGDELMYIATNMSNMVVKFENGCFVGEGPFNTRPLIEYIQALDFESIEVIGNIYENPLQVE